MPFWKRAVVSVSRVATAFWMWVAVPVSVGIAIALPAPQSQAQEAVCFDRDLTSDVFVLQQAPPPRSGVGPYRFYPASAFATMNIGSIGMAAPGTSVYYWQWANHGQRPRPKANILPSLSGPLRRTANFSSRELADECTLAQTAMALGEVPQPSQLLRAVTIDAAPSGEFTDVCVLPPRITGRLAGILLDYEVFDGRSPSETRDFLVRYAALVKGHGKSVILYTNPLDAPTQSRTGISAESLPDITAAFDYVTIFLWKRNRQGSLPESFRSQAEMLGSETRHKGLVTFELAGTSQDDARFVRGLLERREVGGVNFWRNHTPQGGACESDVNRKISCIAFGRC